MTKRTNLRQQLEAAAAERNRARADATAAAAESQRLRQALDALPVGVVVTDLAGGAVFRNRPAQDLVEARHSDSLVARAVGETLTAAADQAPPPRTLELWGPPPRTLVVSAEALAVGGERVGTVAVIEDVSSRRQFEAARRDFVANVSHELRTPVGALAVLAETLCGEDDEGTARRLATRISAEAERVGRLVDDLLDLSRIEVEGLSRRDRVEVAAVVGRAAERVGAAAGQRQVDIKLAGVPERLSVAGDEGQLVSAVANL
ncbi:MAG: histidine kinase dimerization/phospho-acceptor domain-containing protein, partial [Acidimicrobiales bacterium]